MGMHDGVDEAQTEAHAWRVGEGIIEQVGDGLLEGLAVGLDGGGCIGLQMKMQPTLLSGRMVELVQLGE